MAEDKFDFIDNELFEKKLIFNLIFDNNFLDDIIQIIKPKYFNKAHHRWIVEHIVNYYKENQKPASYTTLVGAIQEDNWLRDPENRPLFAKVVKFVKKLKIDEDDKETYEKNSQYIEKMLKDKESIQKSTQEFCKTKRWVEAITKGADLVGSSREDEIPQLMSQVEMEVDPMHVGTDFADMEARIEGEAREGLIKTPWKALNQYIKGVGKNELACWIAGMGAGKSTHASNLALFAYKLGFDVVLYTLELGENYNRQRMDSIMMGVETDNLEDVREELREKLEGYKDAGGSLTIKKFGTGITANTIKNHFNRLRARGKDPDLFIIDYLDLMDSIDPQHNKKRDWEKFGEVTKEIRNEICFKEEIAGHAFVQGNTSAIQDFVIRADSSSGGARRLFPADIVIGLARPDELKAQEKINLSIIKNRFGEDGFYMKGDTDYSIGAIQYHEGAHYNVAGDADMHVKEQVSNDFKHYKKTKNQTQASKKVEDPDEFEFE